MRRVRLPRVIGALVAALALGAPAVPASHAGAQPANTLDRTRLLLEIAEQSDRSEAARAAKVNSELALRAAEAELRRARRVVRVRAVAAYMHGLLVDTPAARRVGDNGANDRLAVALRTVVHREREILQRYRSARDDIAGRVDATEADAAAAAAAEARVEELRAELERLAAVDAAARARDAELRAADEARRRAMAAGGRDYSPTPRDPNALLPRHRRATERQIDLMRRYRFGPLAPGEPLPNGLVLGGRRVDGLASWYGPGFDGRPTASGAIYDQEAWTVANKELPLGTFLLVERGDARVLLLVNDRGPYIDGRVLDLSHAAAVALGVTGVSEVRSEVVVLPNGMTPT